ncbi:hypothetical protein [Paraburkholderia aspalathi]|uniref:hypothetical protein n=1 Tax=Paraburkholderia aspalathi TaxID=1324617 RepID=UPI001B01E6E2|nr:hypothetical protein [Paraburkholderia aspalathi]CAE6842930.1 hypothetical protein R20943_07202 [Paraburkholderia aspalathi]
MLCSIVFVFLAGRLPTQTEQSAAVLNIVGRQLVRSTILELFAWSLVALSTGALIWIAAPFVVTAVHLCSPALASHLSLTPPQGCSAAQGNWFIVKRVMIGYFGLSAVCLMDFACWLAVEHRFASRFEKVMPRWSVMLDESEHE